MGDVMWDLTHLVNGNDMKTFTAKVFTWYYFNPFTPEFLKWTLSTLTMNMSTDAVQSKIKNRMANSVYPDGTVCYKLFYLAPHCLHRYLNQSTENSSTLTPWIDPFPVEGVSVMFYYYNIL